MSLLPRPSRDRRALLAGAIIAVGALALVRGVPRVRRLYADELANAVGLRLRATHMATAVRSANQLRDSLASQESNLVAASGALFSGPSQNAVNASVTAYVGNAARSASVEVGSVQVRQDTVSTSGTRRVTITANARGDIGGLMALLVRLESGPKLIRISSLTVSQPSVAASHEAPETLSFELTLLALALDRRLE